MQPSLVTPVERPLRRVSSVRSALEAQQVASSNADCFPVLTDRGDNKLEKPSVPYILPQIARGGDMGSISESDYGNEPLAGHRRTYSAGEQGVRKNRTIVSYCLGGILSLFLLVQIVTGGLGLLSNPNAVSPLAPSPPRPLFMNVSYHYYSRRRRRRRHSRQQQQHHHHLHLIESD